MQRQLLFVLLFIVFLGVADGNQPQDNDDRSGKIDFPKTPDGKPYKTAGEYHETVMMTGWYVAVKTFVKVVQPNKPPVGTYSKTIRFNIFQGAATVKPYIDNSFGTRTLLFGRYRTNQ